MSIDPSFRTTHSVAILGVSPYQGMEPLAYADFDGSKDYTIAEGQRDATVFLRSEDGGGTALGYAELRQALEKAGGPLKGHDLAKALDAQDSWVGFSNLPPGTSHPIVEYVWSLGADGEIHADYTQARSARVIAPEDGNIASLDLNGDGKSDPANDALIQLERYDDGITWQSFCKAEDLTEAVRKAGGRVAEEDFDTALRSLVDGEPGRITLKEFGHQPDSCDPWLSRTLRLDDNGLVMDFEAHH